MIDELDSVALTRDIPEHSLAAGDVGRVVFRYPAAAAFEIEFLTGEGGTVAVVTLEASDVRPLGPEDILNARRLERR